MQKFLTKTTEYVKSRLTRFLLLAVILTLGFASHFVTQAKYVDFLYDYMGMVGGNYYFTSNYLDEPSAGKLYSISNWDGTYYGISMEVRNYENALQYNEYGTDCYYYVTATVYNSYDEDTDTYSDVSPLPTYTISYYGDDEHPTTRYYYSRIDPDNDYETQRIECGLLPGLRTYDRVGGSRTVSVDVRIRPVQTQTRYLIIRAYTIPMSELGNVTQVTGGVETPITTSMTDGVFHCELEAVFVLERSDTSASIEDVTEQSQTDYMVTYKLKCNSIEGGTSSNVTVHFNPEKLECEGAAAGATQVTATVYSGGMTKLYFFKKRLNDVIYGEDLYFVG